MRVSIHFVWYDLWVGAYWNRASRTLYICPLPMLLIKISLREPVLVTSADDLEETFGKPVKPSVEAREIDKSTYVNPCEAFPLFSPDERGMADRVARDILSVQPMPPRTFSDSVKVLKDDEIIDFSSLLPGSCNEDLFIFTENPTNGAVANASEKGNRMVIWLLRIKSGQYAREVCLEEMERRGIEPTLYLAAYYTARGPDEYPLSEFRTEFLARISDGKPWVWYEPAGFTTTKNPLTVNRVDGG